MRLHWLILPLLALTALALSGCLNRTPDEQTMPWGRPASWENQGPGMGGGF